MKIKHALLGKTLLAAAIATSLSAFASVTLAETDFAKGGINAVYIAKSALASSLTITDPAKLGTWVDVPGATVTVDRPNNTTQLYVARFSAESICSGAVSAWCQVRILAGKNELSPASGTDFAFDSTWDGARPEYSWQAHAMERSATFAGLCSGSSITFKVQYKVNAVGATFRLDDWHFTVEAFGKGDLFPC